MAAGDEAVRPSLTNELQRRLILGRSVCRARARCLIPAKPQAKLRPSEMDVKATSSNETKPFDVITDFKSRKA
jgi:hypothetical protein